MAQVTVYCKAATANWTDADGWNTNADGVSGTNYTNPQNGGGTTFVCDLNSNGPIADVDIVVDEINGAGGGVLAIADGATRAITATITGNGQGFFQCAGTATLTINGAVNYSGTNTTNGAVKVGTGMTVAINGQVSNASSGYCVIASGSGAISISNVGSVAVSNTGSGRGVSFASSGSLTISGAINNTSNGRAVQPGTSGGAISITGTLTSSGTGYCLFSGNGTTTIYGSVVASSGIGVGGAAGTVNIEGNCSTSATGIAINAAGLTVNWYGSRTLSASTDCYMTQTAGTLAFATASAALTLSNSGTFVILKTGGSLTYTAAGGTAAIKNQSATSYASIIGGSDAEKAIITGASIPSAADTRYGVARGWADGGTGATAGCGVAGGNGLLEIPNSDAPTGTQDATSDACVVSGKKYGSPQRTGSAAGGGGVWMPRPRQVGV